MGSNLRRSLRKLYLIIIPLYRDGASFCVGLWHRWYMYMCCLPAQLEYWKLCSLVLVIHIGYLICIDIYFGGTNCFSGTDLPNISPYTPYNGFIIYMYLCIYHDLTLLLSPKKKTNKKKKNNNNNNSNKKQKKKQKKKKKKKNKTKKKKPQKHHTYACRNVCCVQRVLKSCSAVLYSRPCHVTCLVTVVNKHDQTWPTIVSVKINPDFWNFKEFLINLKDLRYSLLH